MTRNLVSILTHQAHSGAIDLLRRHHDDIGTPRLHLAIGFGHLPFAEEIAKALGLRYVGIGHDTASLKELVERGHEAHALAYGNEEKIYKSLQEIIAGRDVASISVLDTLQYAANCEVMLQAVARIAADAGAFVVVSAPNVAHSDTAFRLAFGLWDETSADAARSRQVRYFTGETFETLLRRAGLYSIDTRDYQGEPKARSAAHEHPAAASGTLLYQQLLSIREHSDLNAKVCGFVRLCVTGPRQRSRPKPLERRAANRPFLSIITRTQGRRLHTFREVLTSLAGQSDIDFELLIVGHRLPSDRKKIVQQLIDDCPQWLREKIRLILVEDGNRTKPLNVGFEEAIGRYIAILDDDDMPMGHWVETFKSLDAVSPGMLLRAVALRQNVRTIKVDDEEGLRAEGPLERKYPSSFDFFEHLRSNQTPPVAIAFPRGVFHDLGLRFDGSLTTTEDWDYIMRAAAIVGVASSNEPTCIYRWWISGESSRSVHDQEEWDRNYVCILEKLDTIPVLWPVGTTGRIRYLLESHDQGVIAKEELSAVKHEIQDAYQKLQKLNSKQQKQDDAISLLNSLISVSFHSLSQGIPKSDTGYIDRIIFENGFWQISGWTSELVSSDDFMLVCFLDNGAWSNEYSLLERGDVQALIGGDSSNCGFNFSILGDSEVIEPLVCIIRYGSALSSIVRLPKAGGL